MKFFRAIIAAVALLMLSVVSAVAQTTATPNSQFTWQQQAASVAEANNFVYELELDGTIQSNPLAGVSCTGAATPFDCVGAIPPVTPAEHTARLRARFAGAPIASDWSNLLRFLMVAVPSPPMNFNVSPVQQ